MEKINTKTDLINMLMKRDHITKKEAKFKVDICQQLFTEMLDEQATFDEVEQLLHDQLGIEIDYLFLFI